MGGPDFSLQPRLYFSLQPPADATAILSSRNRPPYPSSSGIACRTISRNCRAGKRSSDCRTEIAPGAPEPEREPTGTHDHFQPRRIKKGGDDSGGDGDSEPAKFMSDGWLLTGGRSDGPGRPLVPAGAFFRAIEGAKAGPGRGKKTV